MNLDLAQYALGVLSGLGVGFALGMFGGGGSILAVPLLVYLVGVPNAHLAIGTSAFAVTANAVSGLVDHARHGTVRWRSAALFSFFGIAGAFAGSTLGKAVDGRRMLLLFGLLMLVIAVLVFRRRDEASDEGSSCTREKVPKILGFGAATGALSGFFGIGGGFLIVPGLIASTQKPMVDAVGSSLVAVTAFGLTTALNYAVSGLVDWRLAAAIVVGGFVGCRVGCFASHHTAARKGLLTSLFAGLIACVAAYMIFEGVTAA